MLGLDGLWIMSPDGSIECQPLGKQWRPKNARLGDLVTLAVLQNLRQLWVSAPWAKAAGLPNNLSDEAVRTGIRHRFASFLDAPAGWKPDQPDRIKPWLNIRSENSELVISMPTLAPELAFGSATDAETMLRSIGVFRALTGFNFVVNPAVVLFNMITMMHSGPGTLDLSASMAPRDFPAVFNIDGPITRDVWARPLTEHERLTGTYVHVFDKNGMYLAAMSSLAVGFGIPKHITHPIKFTKGIAGYFNARITPPATWPATLPHPCFIRPGLDGEFQWQVAPALGFAPEHNCEIEIAEAWLFPETHRPFEPAYNRLRDARAAAGAMTDEVGKIASTAIKQVYTHGIGNFANTRYRDSEDKRNLQRPDWRHCIRSQARANELRNIVKFNLNPFGIRTDAIYLISATADPIEAAGALPIGTTLREWKHVKTLPLSALPSEFFDNKAAANPQRYLDAIKKVEL